MDLPGLGLTTVAGLIKSGAVSSAEYAAALLDRIDARADLCAFITVDPDALLASARRADAHFVTAPPGSLGPLHGVPIAVKDNIDTADLPTTGGTPALRDHRPAADAPAVRAAREAGALVLGKTSLHELAYGVTGENPAFGTARNPYAADRIAGGSSSGTAVAVSARLAPAGFGTDTGGSVRIPAALCGIAGLRPTAGRYDARGTMMVSRTRDTVGPMARTVADLALLDAAATRAAEPHVDTDDLHGVRLGVIRGLFYDDLAPDIDELMDKRLSELEAHGARLVDVELPDGTDELITGTHPIAFRETPETLQAYLNTVPSAPSLAELIEQCGSPDVRHILTSISTDGRIPAVVYQKAMEVYRPALQAVFRDVFSAHRLTALVGPTTPLTAVAPGTETARLGERAVPLLLAYTRNTSPGSAMGWPGLTLPAGLGDTGLPVGLSLDGMPGRDRELLRVGGVCERIFGFLPEPPG
ncbi:amidase family protein [Streptomyces sp. NPDC020681]|uniref:amidase family protein n=1 Tax=Streptomyces sp. NPDC020681 TaxID=3365083 RepID=UPI0037B58408